MQAKSIKGKSTEDIQVALDKMIAEGFQPTLAIMFLSIKQDIEAVLGLLEKNEIDQVKNVWNAPMAGFFTYGEYGRSKIGNNEFHNNACCVVALKEK